MNIFRQTAGVDVGGSVFLREKYSCSGRVVLIGISTAEKRSIRTKYEHFPSNGREDEGTSFLGKCIYIPSHFFTLLSVC